MRELKIFHLEIIPPQNAVDLAKKVPRTLNINALAAEVNTIESECCSFMSNFCSDFNAPKTKKASKSQNTAFPYEASIEYRTLIQTFSSGVTLRELKSIALIICQISPKIKEPNRNEKRNYPLLIEWFSRNWDLVSPLLPFIKLRDENNEIIDGQRELNEMYKK